jgi:hypothetical protein
MTRRRQTLFLTTFFLSFFLFFVKTRAGQWVVVTADTSVKPIKPAKPIFAILVRLFLLLF